MRPLATHKTHTRVPGHQGCVTCHPSDKSGRAGTKVDFRALIQEYEDEECWAQVDALLGDLGPFYDMGSDEWRDWEEYQQSRGCGYEGFDDWEWSAYSFDD